MKYLWRVLLSLAFILSYAQCWAQEEEVMLDDLLFVIEDPDISRPEVLQAMQDFYEAHQLRLSITLLAEDDPYQAFVTAQQTKWLQQSAPGIAITTWHSPTSKAYQRFSVQVNDALKSQLPSATAEEVMGPLMSYYGAQVIPNDAITGALTAALKVLGDHLDALPPPGEVPPITFVNGNGIGTTSASGFDQLTHEAHRSHYETIQIKEESYPVAWKALRNGQPETVLAQVDASLSFPAQVVFKQNGNILPTQAAGEAHQQQLGLLGQGHEQEGSIEVYASGGEDAELVGKLNTISYDALPRTLVLIALDGAIEEANLLRLGQQVQQIYASAGVTIAVRQERFRTDWGNSEVALDDGSSGLLSNYPSELKQVIKDYRKDHQEEKQTAYIFLAGKSKSGNLGFMPKKRSYGFVFVKEHGSNETLEKTIAHELGHGLFRLEHTFEAYPSLTKGSTDNLMDYQGQGTHLHKCQWDLAHNPEAMLGWFQDDGQNAMEGSFEEYVKARLKQLVGSSDNKVLGFGLCQKCENENLVGFTSEVLGENKGELISGPNENCLIFLYNEWRDDLLAGYDEASEKLSFNLATSYDPESKKALFAYLNLEHEALVKLNSPFLTCPAYINEQITSIDLCEYALIEQADFDNIFSAIGKCVEAGKYSLIPPVVYHSLDERLGNNIAKDENIKLVIKSEDEEQSLSNGGEGQGADFEIIFEKIDGRWTASLDVNDSYLSSLGLGQSEVDELQQLLGELFLASQVNFCQGEISPSCFPEMLTFLQVLNIHIQSIAKTGSTHPAVWDDNADEDIDHMVPYNFKWHPIVGGAIDGGVDAAASVPVLIYTAGDILLDESKQQALIAMFSEEGWDQLVEGVFSNIVKTITEQDKLEHAVSKASVELALAYYVAISKAAEGVKEALENAIKLARKLEKGPHLHAYLKKVIKDKPNPVQAKRLEAVLEVVGPSDLEKLLARLDNDQIDDFIADLSGDATFAKRLASDPELVEGWKKMDNLGADETLRRNTGALEVLFKKTAGEVPPLPSTYLDAGYISNHLAKFYNGASYLVPKDVLDRFGRDLLGWPDNNQFVMPKGQMNDLLSKTGNNIEKITTELGIDAKEWAGRELVRIDIPDPKSLNVRIPRGNELGANKNWIPGGKTSGGRPEAVIDNIPKGKYKEIDL